MLEELGAIEGKERTLTPLGHQLARFPVDPRIARMILAGAEYGCLDEVLVVAAALNLQDPRERPRELAQKADELHRRFRDEHSDFMGLLKLWEFVREAEGAGHVAPAARVPGQLPVLPAGARVAGRPAPARGDRPRAAPAAQGPGRPGARETPCTRRSSPGSCPASASGIRSSATTRARSRRASCVHPSSALARKPPAWVMAFELVETSQLFARTVAKLDPEWLAAAAPHLLKRSYSEPHWSEKSARAVVKENATLFGLAGLQGAPRGTTPAWTPPGHG